MTKLLLGGKPKARSQKLGLNLSYAGMATKGIQTMGRATERFGDYLWRDPGQVCNSAHYSSKKPFHFTWIRHFSSFTWCLHSLPSFSSLKSSFVSVGDRRVLGGEQTHIPPPQRGFLKGGSGKYPRNLEWHWISSFVHLHSLHTAW